MQRIMNDPDHIVDEYVEGFLKTHNDIVEGTDNKRVVKVLDIPEGKTGVITGGGSGHKPAFIGYVGEGLCDAVAIGEICSSPTADAFFDAAKVADQGRGVACLYGNYSGDNMNVKMAVKMAAKQGIVMKTVVANDDVASAPKTEPEKRRGVAGEILMWKCGGAAAAQGADLDEVIRVAQKAIDHTRSVGVGLSPCTLPAVGHPNFEIKEGTMELGIGHHGEPGIAVVPLESAAGIAKRMTDIVLPDYPFESGDDVVVLVSGLGATPVMELYVYYNEVEKILTEKGIHVHRSYVGNYFTSLEMMGVTLTMMKLDDELKELIDAPCYSMGLKQKGSAKAQETHKVAAAAPKAEVHAEAADDEPVKKAVVSDIETDDRSAGHVFNNKAGKSILLKMVKGIQDNKAYLGEVDGLIGDGDHGMNMNKGFTLFETRFADKDFSFTEGLEELSAILMREIGGSMGPIYGTILSDMASAAEGKETISVTDLALMLESGLQGLQEIVGARVGDKTLVDTLSPSADSMKESAKAGLSFAEALPKMKAAAEAGRDSTKELVAKFGRSARLGERSRGVLDAGATSCCIILCAMADGIQEVVK